MRISDCSSDVCSSDLIVVGAVALAATGLGLAGVPAILGASTATIATAASVAAAGINIVGNFAIPKPSFNTGQQLNFVTDPQSGLPYAMGRTRMSGLRIYADTHDGYGNQAKDDMLTFGAMLSVGGQIDSIEKFVADETVYKFNPTTGRANGDYSNWMGQKVRSEEHKSELQSLMRISYAVFCLKKKKQSTLKSHDQN